MSTLKEMNNIPYLSEAIDLDSPYANRYLDLVSKSDSSEGTHRHHIVPVTYYLDVLGCAEVRKVGTPDMAEANLVYLTRGRHLLAHYYLSKCARECIRHQAVSAFRIMYDTTDPATDENVFAFASEMDDWYANTANVGPYRPKNPRPKVVYDPDNCKFHHVFDRHRFTMSIKENGKIVKKFTWQDFRLTEYTGDGYYVYIMLGGCGHCRARPHVVLMDCEDTIHDMHFGCGKDWFQDMSLTPYERTVQILRANGCKVHSGFFSTKKISNDYYDIYGEKPDLRGKEALDEEIKLIKKKTVSMILSLPEFVDIVAPEGKEFFMEIERSFLERVSVIHPDVKKYVYPEIPDIPERFVEKIRGYV